MRYFPLFLDLRGRPVLVAGGGAVAERKVKLLLASGARVTVVAPELVRRAGPAGGARRDSGIGRANSSNRTWNRSAG